MRYEHIRTEQSVTLKFLICSPAQQLLRIVNECDSTPLHSFNTGCIQSDQEVTLSQFMHSVHHGSCMVPYHALERKPSQETSVQGCITTSWRLQHSLCILTISAFTSRPIFLLECKGLSVSFYMFQPNKLICSKQSRSWLFQFSCNPTLCSWIFTNALL
jgi:hypothetical protein